VLLLNSNGMDAVVSEDAVSLRALGGVLDLFVLLGPAPRDVLGQLAAAVGRPALPPFWALGFHQSKCAARLCRRANPVQARGAAASPPRLRDGRRVRAGVDAGAAAPDLFRAETRRRPGGSDALCLPGARSAHVPLRRCTARALGPESTPSRSYSR